MFAPVLEHGLVRARLDAIVEDLRNAHRELQSRRDKDIGLYDVPSRIDGLKAIHTEVTRLRSLADDLVVLGIGGSSLGGQAIRAALSTTADPAFRLHFVDNVDPDTLAALLGRLEPGRTSVLVITKSGTTVEPLAQMLILRRWFRVTLGQGETRSRMTFVTDPTTGFLRDLARKEGIRAFDIPQNVGGRYSVLTPVGLLPAAFVGIDIDEMLAGARAMVDRVTADDVLDNPACLLAAGAFLALRDLGRTSLVLMPYCDALKVFSTWFVQLWAESLGKKQNRLGEIVHAGQTPIAALGASDQHAQLQLFIEGPADKAVILLEVSAAHSLLPIPDELPDREEVAFLHGRDLGEVLSAERRATRATLLDSAVPVIDVKVPTLTPATLGGLFVLFSAACACVGIMLGVNPFDQPGVETGKRMALGLLGRPGYEKDTSRVVTREALAEGKEPAG